MKRASQEKIEREALRTRSNREELTGHIAQALPNDGRVEPIEGLTFYRSSSPTGPLHAVAQPCLCVIAQGSKEVQLGENPYQYDPFHYLLVTANLPLVGHVLEASKKHPYLSLRLILDPTLVSSVMVEAGHVTPQNGTDVRAIDVSPLSTHLLDAVVRLVRLSPADMPVLAPLIKREIVYRLLTGEQGARLRHIAVLGGHSHRITRAVQRLYDDFDQSIPIENLAEEFGMSVSSFHYHFKAVTGMTPLQFQKQLQLQEARRLMLSEDLDAATAGYRVGYNDASHFNREYKRLFGQPPMRDVARLQEAARENAESID